MQIYIFGDLSFATFMLRGVSMLYSADGTFIQAALILSLLFLLWSFIKWSLNPEKTTYPVREWAFGLIFFLILGGTSLSPKFRVTLIHANHGATPATFVDDVPLLAAAPSWLATNLFRTITQRIETAGPFIMPGYEKFRGVGMSKPDADPLNALVKLNSLANTAILDRHFEIQIKDYIKQCYLPHIAFNPSFPALKFTKNNITQLEIWDDLLVSNVHLTITTTGQDGAPVTQSCIAFHADFKNSLTSDVPGTFRSSAAKAAASRNISEQEVRAGAQIIFENLTGSPGNPNPVNIMQNMFLIRSIKDSINTLPEAASLQTWTNKMVFEAERKRTFEAAGERSLFMKLYIPTITTIETFSFFIAPVLMILSVLGGYGFSLIGKYLMLVLFINLWSFIKVFVDIFTALSLATAFKQIGPVPDGSDINKFLGFETYAQTISEIESLLTVASNLTMAIPFFAMFLLYGGIHSVMGVMRTVTGGSVDGSNMAPTIATSMNSSTMQMGDTQQSMVVSTGQFAQSHNPGTDARYGSTIASNSSTSGAGGATQLIRSQIDTETSGFNQALSTAFTNATKASTSQSSGSTETATNNRGVTWMEQTSDTFSGSYSNSQSQSAQILSRLAATLGGKIAAGSSKGSHSDPEKQRELLSVTTDPTKKGLEKSLVSMGLSADVAGQLVAGMTEDDVKTFSQQVNTAKQNATQFMKNENIAGADMYSDLQAYMKEVTKSDSYNQGRAYVQTISRLENQQASIGTNFSNDKGLTNSSSLAWNVLDPSYATFQAVYNNLNDNQRQRLAELGLGNDGYSVANSLAAGDPNVLGNGVLLSQRLIDNVNKKDNNLETAASDAKIAAGIFNTLGQLAGPVYGNGFNRAAESNLNLSDILTGTDKANNTLKPDTSSVQTGPLPNTIQGFDANGNPISGVNKQQAKDATSQSVPRNVNGASGLVPLLTAEDFDKMRNNQFRDLSNIINAGKSANDVGMSVINGIGDWVKFFSGREQLWGKDADTWSGTVASAANATGNNSLAIREGLKDLRTISHQDIAPLVKKANEGDLNAIRRLSSMNDAFQYLNSEQGMYAVQALGEKEGMQLVRSMQILDSNLNKLVDSDNRISRGELDAISQARASGQITDRQADTLLRVGSSERGTIPETASFLTGMGLNVNDDIRSTLFTLTQGSAKDNEVLRQIVSNSNVRLNDIDQPIFSPTYANNFTPISQLLDNYDNLQPSTSQYANAANRAAVDIVSDSFMVSHNGGLIQYDGISIQGFNAEFALNDRIVNQLSNYTSRIVNQYDNLDPKSMNTNLVDRAVDGKGKAPAQELIFALSAFTGPSQLEQRLQDSGLSGVSQAVNFTVSDLKERAIDAGLVNNEAELREQYYSFIKK